VRYFQPLQPKRGKAPAGLFRIVGFEEGEVTEQGWSGMHAPGVSIPDFHDSSKFNNRKVAQPSRSEMNNQYITLNYAKIMRRSAGTQFYWGCGASSRPDGATFAGLVLLQRCPAPIK
jgi:hypothetical protein